VPNEVRIKIIADKPDNSGLKSVEDELKKTQAEAGTTGRSMDSLTEQFKATGVSADHTGESIKGVSDNMTEADRAGTRHRNTLTSLEDQYKKVNADITTSRGELVKLTRALIDTDNAAQRMDISKAIAKVNQELSRSTSAKKLLLDVDPKLDPGEVQRLGKDAAPLFEKIGMSPIGLALGVGVAAAAAPFIGSAIAGAVAGGVGLGGIAGGVALAMKDNTVSMAVGELSRTFLKGLSGSAAKWFEGPILDAIPVARTAANKLVDSLDHVFANLAPYLKPLVSDIGASVDRIGAAFEKVSSRAGPALSGLGGTIKLISDGVGSFLESVSENGEAAGSSLMVLGGIIRDVLRVAGGFINFLDKLSTLPGPLNALREHYAKTADASHDLGKATGQVAQQMDDATEAAIGERGALEGLASELKAQTDPVFAVINAQKRLADAHKAEADALKKGKGGQADYNQAVRDAAEASISLESAVGKLGGTFDGKMTPALEATLRAAGLTKPEIANLAKQFKGAEATGDNFAKVYAAEAKLNGADATHRQLTQLEKEAKAYARTWTATMITHYIQTGKPSSGSYVPQTLGHGLAHGGIKGAASGMVGSDLTWVGEQGPELVSLPVGSTVHSAPDSARMAAQGGNGGDPLLVVLQLDGNTVATAIVDPMRRKVRQLGAGSAQRFFGQPGVK
jgi:hypothetical protein